MSAGIVEAAKRRKSSAEDPRQIHCIAGMEADGWAVAGGMSVPCGAVVGDAMAVDMTMVFCSRVGILTVYCIV